MSDAMLVETADGVLRLTFNRPDALNALTAAMLAEAAEAVDATDARVVVLTGAGRAFSSGADLTALGEGDTHVEANRLVRAIAATPRPVVAAVNGPAAGVGCSIALVADFTIAKASAYLLQAFVNIGLMPDGAATEIVAASIGRARANAMALLGERLPAPEAERLGLIHQCLEEDAFDDAVEALVTKLANGPTQAYARAKAALNANTLARLDQTLDSELTGQRELADTADAVEGITAFIQKRPPSFTGR